MKEIEIYVTIPVVPNRSFCVQRVIDSYLSQTFPPKKVIINVCNKYTRFPNEAYDTSPLEKYKDNEIVYINYLNKDYGPSSHVIGATQIIELNPNKIQHLFICDDDKILPPHKLEAFAEAILEKPEASHVNVIRPCQVTGATRYGKANFKPAFHFDISYGSSGWSLPLRTMQKFEKLYDQVVEEAPTLIYQDDILFSLLLHDDNVKIKKIKNAINNEIDNPEGTQINAISRGHNPVNEGQLVAGVMIRPGIRDKGITIVNKSWKDFIMKNFPHINSWTNGTTLDRLQA
ncbi:hypothetical protein CL634_10550 [bacterium]|nr:hypothetical protein [bacterium]|tara:strand:+ start:570 stop:1433 length:864 start_codon:yes stop_codon:yes gene_type:complete